MFAKLYEDKELGQVLVRKVNDKEVGDPEIGILLEDDDVTIEAKLCYSNTDEGFSKRDAAFENMTEEIAVNLARNFLTKIKFGV